MLLQFCLKLFKPDLLVVIKSSLKQEFSRFSECLSNPFFGHWFDKIDDIMNLKKFKKHLNGNNFI